MRGPGYRLDLDVRRVWRCPRCGKERRLGGEVTAVTCICGQSMNLVEERRPRGHTVQPLVSRELTVESFALTEEELARPIPTRPPREVAAEANAPTVLESHGRTPSHPPRRPRRGGGVPGAEMETSAAVPPVVEDSPIEPDSVDASSAAPSDEVFGAGLDETAPREPNSVG
jgi:hypothetical protein